MQGRWFVTLSVRIATVWFFGLALEPAQAADRRVALLVGISQYQDKDIKSLEGPAHDVAALRDVLVQRWGFKSADIRTLVDKQATRVNVLAELDALGKRSGAGDEVLIYFSGHGTSALDAAAAELPVPHGSGAFLTHDFSFARPEAGLIVGRTDLVPLIGSMEDGGRRLWVVMDTCYSGQAVRQVQPAADPKKWPERAVTLSRPNAAARLAALTPARLPPPYPYRATAFLAAAAEGETAKDVPHAKLRDWPTFDGLPHGAFTDALLRVLNGQVPGDLNDDGWLDLNEVHYAVGDYMAKRPYGHSPQRLPAVSEDPYALGARPVLAQRRAATAPEARPPAPLTVRTEQLPPALNTRLSGLPDVRLVGGGRADLVIARSADAVDVVDAAGDLRRRVPLAEADKLARIVRQLAWLHKLRALAEQGQRAALQMSLEPQATGGNFIVGETLNLSIRPDRTAWLALLNLDSDGNLSVLYPTARHETQSRPAAQLLQVPPPSSPLRVRLPEGKDEQIGLAFDQDISAELLKLAPLEGGDATELQAAVERLTEKYAKRFSFGHTEFRTWERRSP